LITWLFGVGCPNAKGDVASSVEHGGLLMCVEDESHLSDGRVDGELVKNKKEGEARQGQKANGYPLRI
jgi:hypothetical protein